MGVSNMWGVVTGPHIYLVGLAALGVVLVATVLIVLLPKPRTEQRPTAPVALVRMPRQRTSPEG